LGHFSGNCPANLQVAIGKVPCDKDNMGSGRAWSQCSLEKNGSTIPPPGVNLVGSFIGRECAGGDFAPECRQRVKIPSWAAQPHPSAVGSSTLCRNTPRPGITVLRLFDSSPPHPGAK